ncbi:Hypothetical protein CpCap5W_0775 [Corynebacterium pseudotuberculosis]|nr:Hypothetical protein Cp3995_1924 [Corynebacterium pseudotuberculosis 3/99-5]AIG06086.1 hypothetical protein CPTA_00257 [Corynebacterium pseudotuberculosis]AIG09329.1 hypothetical protein CPTB_01273 [Corynebacterium pseudotuberculosis]AIG11229.1 hypothetical protein CPTC_00941 [Corynebacterium pseudotuberculosis]AKC74637.1 Hypothetical protein Cp226_1946 [Corynebacterium pseudotuberculosis]
MGRSGKSPLPTLGLVLKTTEQNPLLIIYFLLAHCGLL